MKKMTLLCVALLLLNVFIALMPISNAVNLTGNCYALWHMNESSGNNVVDSSGNKRTSQSPIFFNETPANGTTGVNLSLYWNITIEDPDADTFSWWINCSNGNTSHAVGATNGTKSLHITGLANETVYRVWVNATDGSTWTRAWYVFQTLMPNRPPIIFNEFPINDSFANPLQLIWNCTIQDPDGDDFDWWINCSSGDKNHQDDVNGSKFVLIFFVNYTTTYRIWVNATDGLHWTNRTYYVHTTGIPTIATYYPIQIGISINVLLVVLMVVAFVSPLFLLFARRRKRSS